MLRIQITNNLLRLFKYNYSMNWTSYAVSHPGNKRKFNQDAYFCHDQHGIWAIADGMGGHEAGDVASQTIIQSLANLAQSGAENNSLMNITSLLEDVNQQLFAQNQANDRMVGSTIALVQVDNNICHCLWVGDSRIYLYRQQQFAQISSDHSYVQQLVDNGEITAKQAKTHQKRNVLTRAIGSAEELSFDTKNITVYANDKILICSDGLYSEVSTEEITAILEYSSAQTACENLLNLCLSRQANDNVSFVLVEIK